MRKFHFLCLTLLAGSTLWAGVVMSDPQVPAESSEVPEETMELMTVEEITELPVAYARIAVEYPDTIVECRTDSAGILIFTPHSFPLTMTITADDFEDTTFGLLNAPEETLKIELQPRMNDKN